MKNLELKAKMQICLGVLILLVSLLFNTEAATMESSPDWIKGVLYLSLLEYNDSELFPKQFICFCDFNNKSIQSINVPLHSKLLKENYSGKPIVVYGNSYEDRGKVSVKYYVQYLLGSSLKCIPVMLENSVDIFGIRCVPLDDTLITQLTDDPLFRYSRREAMDIVKNNSEVELYYLRQITGQTDSPAMELVRHHLYTSTILGYDSNETILTTNLDDFHHHIQWYAISPNGTIAWLESDFEMVSLIINDHVEKTNVLSEPNTIAGPICWLNDDTLIYVVSTVSQITGVNAEIRILNMYSGISQDISTMWEGEPLDVPERIVSIDVDMHSDMLIALLETRTTSEFDNPNNILLFINLKTGDSYRWNPWSKTMKDQNGYYLETNEGIALCQPSGFIDTTLVLCDSGDGSFCHALSMSQ